MTQCEMVRLPGLSNRHDILNIAQAKKSGDYLRQNVAGQMPFVERTFGIAA